MISFYSFSCRRFAKKTAATLFCFLTALLPVAADKPNIVFFFVDDQPDTAIGCYGNDVVKTPTIDRLAAEGVRFSNAFVSQPICWVSRTSILTGLTARSYGTPGAHDDARAEAVETLYSDVLMEHGYRTGFYGKWHARMPRGYKPAAHFDEFEVISRDPFFKKLPDGTLRHETDLIVDRGIEFLKSQPKGKPFHLNMWFNACHAEDNDRRPGIGHFPWPQSADGMYEDIEVPLPKLRAPEIFESQPDFFKTTITRERYFWRWNTDYKYGINKRSYMRMTSGIDMAIERFMKELEAAGFADNTIIVYSADNGFHLANRGFAGKWSHYEESIRVPLIITDPRLPSDKRGKVSDAFALNLDFPSTFLDWAGIEVPNHYEGSSLRPILEGEVPADWRSETFHEHFAVRQRIPAHEGVRDGRFKYARYFDHGNYEFLHDLVNDPDELVNLAGDPAHAGKLADMRSRTDAAIALYGGPIEAPKVAFEASTPAHPEASAAVSVRPGKDGFVNLFNGNSLNGWEGDRKYWSVEDGAITGKTDGSLDANRFLSWKGSTIRNFDLRVKVKISPGGNSGIQYRGEMRPEVGLDIVDGYQCDIVANQPRYHGMLYEERGRRILAHTGEKVIVAADGQPWITGTMEVKEFPPDEWQDFRVLVRGNHHQHWVNGHPTVDVIDLDEKGRAGEGVLAVQVHVGPAMKVQFKDFRIKHLPDDLPLEPAVDHLIPKGSAGVRPQGRLPADWVPPLFGE